LIKEIKDHYDLEEFFKTKLPHYKAQASIYTLIESAHSEKKISIDQIINNKISLIEHLTSIKQVKEVKDDILTEFAQYDKDTRILAYKILLDKFNTKYSDFSENKKSILKEFIYSVDNNNKLKDFYNTKIDEFKNKLSSLNKSTKNQVTKIKINEVANLLTELNKKDKVIIVDDLIATGGTALASAKLIKKCKANVSAFIFLIDLFDLPGNEKLQSRGYRTFKLINFPGH
jgi:phosphoribosylpyrophosphate synthetase